MAYRGPAKQRKIRKTTSNNQTGDSYAVTIPKNIARQFEKVNFNIVIYGNNIILQSGASIKQ